MHKLQSVPDAQRRDPQNSFTTDKNLLWNNGVMPYAIDVTVGKSPFLIHIYLYMYLYSSNVYISMYIPSLYIQVDCSAIAWGESLYCAYAPSCATFVVKLRTLLDNIYIVFKRSKVWVQLPRRYSYIQCSWWKIFEWVKCRLDLSYYCLYQGSIVTLPAGVHFHHYLSTVVLHRGYLMHDGLLSAWLRNFSRSFNGRMLIRKYDKWLSR